MREKDSNYCLYSVVPVIIIQLPMVITRATDYTTTTSIIIILQRHNLYIFYLSRILHLPLYPFS